MIPLNGPLQHENDLPLAGATTSLGCQRTICPETTTTRSPSTSVQGWVFFGNAVGRQASPGGPIAKVQSHKAAIGSAEKDISRDVKNSQDFGPALTPLVQT